MLLVPSHENEYASVGTVAEVAERIRLPGGGRAVVLNGLHRGVLGAAESDPRGNLRVEVEERPDSEDWDAKHASSARVPRDRRGDPRAARRRRPCVRVPARDRRPGCARRHGRLLARRRLRAEDAPPRDARPARAARARDRAPARGARDARRSPAHPRRRRGGRAEATARVHPPAPDGLDPQGARRGRLLGHRGVPPEARGARAARTRPRAGRARARPLRADGRAGSRVADDPDIPRLALLGAVGEDLGGASRPRRMHARCSTRTTTG